MGRFLSVILVPEVLRFNLLPIPRRGATPDVAWCATIDHDPRLTRLEGPLDEIVVVRCHEESQRVERRMDEEAVNAAGLGGDAQGVTQFLAQGQGVFPLNEIGRHHRQIVAPSFVWKVRFDDEAFRERSSGWQSARDRRTCPEEGDDGTGFAAASRFPRSLAAQWRRLQ